MDDTIRQATRGSGYQINSVPELQRMIAMCRNWSPRTPTASPRAPTATPAPRPRSPTATPSTARTSGLPDLGPVGGKPTGPRIPNLTDWASSLLRRLSGAPQADSERRGPVASTVQSDGVDIGSGQIKLGWVLYGRTDMTEEQAKAEYRARADARAATLDRAVKEAQEREAAAQRRLDKFEEAVRAKNPSGLADKLREERAEAQSEHAREVGKLVAATAGLAPGVIGEGAHAASGTAELSKFAASAGEKVASGRPFAQEDWDHAGNGFASYVSVAGSLAGAEIGLPIAAAQAGLQLMTVRASEARLSALENALQQTTRPVEENRRLFQARVEEEAAKRRALEQQAARLREDGRYLDLVRP